jgi:hypothetical protein
MNCLTKYIQCAILLFKLRKLRVGNIICIQTYGHVDFLVIFASSRVFDVVEITSYNPYVMCNMNIFQFVAFIYNQCYWTKYSHKCCHIVNTNHSMSFYIAKYFNGPIVRFRKHRNEIYEDQECHVSTQIVRRRFDIPARTIQRAWRSHVERKQQIAASNTRSGFTLYLSPAIQVRFSN